MPTVAIIIAAYNASATIGRASASALAESDVAEVIVVDDASTDDTVAIAQGCDDGSGRLKILRQDKNAGPSAARNRAIASSSAPWVGVLDADDFFLPGRIAGLLAYAEEADMIADDMWQVAEEAVDGPRRALLGKTLTAPRIVSFADFVLSNVTQRGRQRAELGFIKPLMRRAFLETHNLRYQEHMRLGEDFELYARALGFGARLLLVPAQGYVSVVRAGSLSGQHGEMDLLHLRDSDIDLGRDLALSSVDSHALTRHTRSVDCRLQWRLLILAVKHRKPKAALRCFLRPWPVPGYLFGQLLGQVYQRGLKRA